MAKRLLMPKSTLAKHNGRHNSYEVSIRKRKQIEERFGWMKGIGLMRKLRHRGKMLVNQPFLFTAAIYNLVRMKGLLA